MGLADWKELMEFILFGFGGILIGCDG